MSDVGIDDQVTGRDGGKGSGEPNTIEAVAAKSQSAFTKKVITAAAAGTSSAPARGTGTVQVIRRVAAILRALHDAPEGLSLSQLSERVDLARSTIHRLVTTLEEERFVNSSPDGYRLGPGLMSLVRNDDADIARKARPFMVSLSRQLQETVDLAVLEQDTVHFIDQVSPSRRLRAVSSIGAYFPVHCTANGKALLATMPDESIAALLPKRLPRLTPNTIVNRSRLFTEVQKTRESGVAFDREEHTLGICAVGAVISDPFGRSAAVTIPMPSQRFYGNEKSLARTLQAACARITKALATP